MHEGSGQNYGNGKGTSNLPMKFFASVSRQFFFENPWQVGEGVCKDF